MRVSFIRTGCDGNCGTELEQRGSSGTPGGWTDVRFTVDIDRPNNLPAHVEMTLTYCPTCAADVRIAGARDRAAVLARAELEARYPAR